MNRPMALVCFICGRQFGTKSLGIHIKSCQQKWQNQEGQKPSKLRRPCPQAPPGLRQLLSKDNITRQDIMNFNNGSFNTFMEQALVQCQYCGRKFNEKSLVPHQKACMKQPMIRKPYVSKQQREMKQIPLKTNNNMQNSNQNSYQNPNFEAEEVNQNLVPCRKCGRKFNSDRVGKHEKVCKQQKKVEKKAQQKNPIINSPMKPNLLKKKGPLQEKPPKWKIQHQQLQNAMKAMRQIKKFEQKGGNIRDMPQGPPSNYDHYTQCKYCGRKYAPDVAERHIPKCANIINKPGGIQKSKIGEKYIGTSGVKKIQSPMIPMKSEMKNYQLTKPSYQKTEVQVTKSMLKPNMKPMTGTTIKNTVVKKR